VGDAAERCGIDVDDVDDGANRHKGSQLHRPAFDPVVVRAHRTSDSLLSDCAGAEQHCDAAEQREEEEGDGPRAPCRRRRCVGGRYDAASLVETCVAVRHHRLEGLE
jgi:hypothetical protein